MVNSLEEIQADEIRFVEKEKKTLKAQKKNAFAEVKKTDCRIKSDKG